LSGKADKFLKLSGREKMLFLEAVLLHLWVGLLLMVIPFRHIPRLFVSRQYDAPAQLPSVVFRIRDAVGRAGRVSPWRNRCLVSSLAGRCMLRRRKIGSLLSLGVAKGSDGKTVAHAWLRSGENEIVERRGDYTELFSF
jgi:hypothetical protein